MKLAEIAIEKRTITLTLSFIMLVTGLLVFNNMSRLEDPEFTIKDALVITEYNGASAKEVELEVTEKLEEAVQKLGEVDKIVSKSERGFSTITVSIKERYNKDTLPQVWDKLRKKIDDVKSSLPPGAGPPIVMDDYGDVYSIYMVVTGDGYSYSELKSYIDNLKNELLQINGVGKVDTFGERREAVYIEFNRDRLSQLGIPLSVLTRQLRSKGLVVDAGQAKTGSYEAAIVPTGGFRTVEDLNSLLISNNSSKQFYLKDIATVRRDYLEPINNIIKYDGKKGIGIGISTVSGGNVVEVGDSVLTRLKSLKKDRPIGIELNYVSLQSKAVQDAISTFLESLVQAVLIVIFVLLIFMGVKSGLLIGFVLILTITGSFIFLDPLGVALERISLGALVIALGMLVDNAIVIVDSIIVRVNMGESARSAAPKVVRQSAFPLLAATLIAVLGFAAIGTSNDATGEYCRSLFQVVSVSLLFSWIIAVTVTPLLCVILFKNPDNNGKVTEPYQGIVYSIYRIILRKCIKNRYISLAIIFALFLLSVFGFYFVEQSFFPSSTRDQFMVDMWLPQGTHIEDTEQRATEVEQYLVQLSNVSHVTTTVGEGSLRFLLTYQPEFPNKSYAQFLVDVKDYREINKMIPKIEKKLSSLIPNSLIYASSFQLGTGISGKIQSRISGPDSKRLRKIANKVEKVFLEHENTKATRINWRQKEKVIKAVIDEETANINGITRTMIAETIREAFEGVTTGVFRDGKLLLPIILRSSDEFRKEIGNINNIQIWSPVARRMIPLRQVVTSFETMFEDGLIFRRNKERTITIITDPINGTANDLLKELKPKIEKISLPKGYRLEWGGEYEEANKAENSLSSTLPIFIVLMVLLTIIMFNSLRQALVIWLCVPLAIIGVTIGLLITSQPFGFMALLGLLSLTGMLIKNAIVLVEEINIEQRKGEDVFNSVINSGVNRLRPVSMAALTTALGMIPLIFDAFFVSMAVTIISGLLFASLLTMIVIPLIYTIIFKPSCTINIK